MLSPLIKASGLISWKGPNIYFFHVSFIHNGNAINTQMMLEAVKIDFIDGQTLPSPFLNWLISNDLSI